MNESMPDSEFAHENDDGQIQYAGFWIRAGASIIDMLLVMAVLLPVLWLFTSNVSYPDAEEPGHWLIDLLDWAFWAVVTILFWIYFQATPGKMAVRVKIADARSGGKPSVGQCIGRYFASILSILFFGLGLLWVAFDKRKQGWHDKLAGTVVIKRPRTPVIKKPPERES